MAEPALAPARTVGPAQPFRVSAVPPPTEGPDEYDRYPELDFGPLRVRVPPGAGVRMAAEGAPHSDAVYFDFPSGSIRLSVFAVARSGQLWPERAEEIASVQAGIGARVSSVWGAWGRELHIVQDDEYNWVIGVDGSRWMLLGRATWTTGAGWELVDVMRSMIRHARVERGAQPLPVRAPLPLRSPGAPEEVEESGTPYAAVVTMLTPPADEPTPGAGTARAPASSAPPPVPPGSRRAPGLAGPGRTDRRWAVTAAALVLFAGVGVLALRGSGDAPVGTPPPNPPVALPGADAGLPSMGVYGDAYPRPPKARPPAAATRAPRSPVPPAPVPKPSAAPPTGPAQPAVGRRSAAPSASPPSRPRPPGTHVDSEPRRSEPQRTGSRGSESRRTEPRGSEPQRAASRRPENAPKRKTRSPGREDTDGGVLGPVDALTDALRPLLGGR